MTENRPFGSWLRAVSGLLAAAAVLTLAACGGGSGAPNNPYSDGELIKPLVVLPNAAVDVYAGVPTVLTISGGKGPFTAASSNSAAVPVASAVSGSTIVVLANDVPPGTEDTGLPVTVTVRDSNGALAVAELVVHPSTLFSGITVTPNSADCGTGAICSGQNGVAAIKVLSPTGAPLAGRAVRFEVVAGAFGIVSTAPGSPVVSSFTVTSDALGNASVIIKANVNAPTQQAQIRATDLTGGQQVTGSFLIQQVTDGAKVLSVVPPTVTITGPDNKTCSSGARVDYFIYGGTPPYRVTAAFPFAGTVLYSPVLVSGGYFEVVTNGTCSGGDGLQYSILDATGLQISAFLKNELGEDDPTPIPEPLTVNPSPIKCGNAGAGKSTFVITGGTPTYYVVVKNFTGSATPPTIDPQTGIDLGKLVTVTGLPPSGTVTLTIGDVAGQTFDRTITCP
jgi:hypothetical protein